MPLSFRDVPFFVRITKPFGLVLVQGALEVAQGGLGRNRAGVYRVVCTHDLVLLLGEWAIGAVGGHRRRRQFFPLDVRGFTVPCIVQRRTSAAARDRSARRMPAAIAG
jgi:hypothetical protein